MMGGMLRNPGQRWVCLRLESAVDIGGSLRDEVAVRVIQLGVDHSIADGLGCNGLHVFRLVQMQLCDGGGAS